jgi:hypothetical protein
MTDERLTPDDAKLILAEPRAYWQPELRAKLRSIADSVPRYGVPTIRLQSLCRGEQ